MKKIGNFECPSCGKNFEMFTEVNNAAGNENSHMSKAEKKLAMLKEAGIDTSRYFVIPTGCDDGKIGMFDGCDVKVVQDADPVFDSIRVEIAKSGVVPNRELFRRWLPSQYLHLMAASDYRDRKLSFTEALARKGENYMWDMTLEELRVQARMLGKDMDNLTFRNRFFNKNLVVDMLLEYASVLRGYVNNGQKKVTRRGKTLVFIPGYKWVTQSLVNDKVFMPITCAIDRVKESSTPEGLYKALNEFVCNVKRNIRHKQFSCWVSAYKGVGAFYTMRSLILFNGCYFYDGIKKLGKEESIKALDAYAESCSEEGYKMHGLIKEFLHRNGIDVEKKLSEWRSK